MEAVHCSVMVVQQNLDIANFLWVMRCRRQLAGVGNVAVVNLGIGADLV